MKKLSRVLAIILAVLMLVPLFAGCHEKDEIAFTIGEHKFTSAMYSCVLFLNGSSARNAIYDYVREKEPDTDTNKINYSKYKFDEEGNVKADGTISYDDYIRNNTIKVLKRFAALQTIMKEKNLTLDEQTLNVAKVQTEYMWYVGCDYATYQQYGQSAYNYFTPYGIYFEANDVAYSTYEQYNIYEATYSYYFEKLYGEGGEKEVSKEDLTKHMTENYAVIDAIVFSYLDSEGKKLSDDEINKLKAKAEGYASRINEGEDFKKIYDEYTAEKKETADNNNYSSNTSTTSSSVSSTSSIESTTSSTTSSGTSSGTEEEKKYTPNEFTIVIGGDKTAYSSGIYEDVKKLDNDVATVINDKDSSRYVLVTRRDMTAEEYENYWLDLLKLDICYALKQDEFNTDVDKKGAGLEFYEDTYATGIFEVEDIEF